MITHTKCITLLVQHSVAVRMVLTDGDTGTDNPGDGADRTPIDEAVTADISGTAQISYASSSITLADNAAVNHVFSLPDRQPGTTNSGSLGSKLIVDTHKFI